MWAITNVSFHGLSQYITRIKEGRLFSQYVYLKLKDICKGTIAIKYANPLDYSSNKENSPSDRCLGFWHGLNKLKMVIMLNTMLFL